MQLLRKLAFPISLVYGLVVHVRNVLYDFGILKSTSFKTPTICVGNLSVGGTGKTPMIEYLVALLQDRYKVAVLSRGYKRKSKGFQIASDGGNVEELGDEPYQIFKKFPKITVAVDADRCNGIANLEKSVHPDLVLLDDAFQHRKVKPGFSILLTAYDGLYSKDRYLPTGNLRDSKREARRAHVIVVTKCPDTLDNERQTQVLKSLKPKKEQQVLFSQLRYDHRLKGNGAPLSLEDLLGQRVTLVTGIANPKPLVGYLIDRGVDLEHLEYRDHHFFSTSEIGLFNSKPIVLTTEKDFARLKGKVADLYYIQVKHEFLNGGGAILEKAIHDFMQ
ncbi:tetraacyldisaccharide 4'-kinase [Maribacter polysaccharolyticus]|uniref:tetraacyldisaccharide 4'-kinase n=1 Tax=Maribacter polysaccharolyticus TaxID=3020831 RepID=UPI00237EFACA|nr:tetraacyldisaccharide 4'-kinase [Maribacter polysaccharolyticus]MDE3743910.1 tetraacyldisaccharide 4'-kinase [Maribacter polysaccharolyticus]